MKEVEEEVLETVVDGDKRDDAGNRLTKKVKLLKKRVVTERKVNLLLVSGYWGWARHFHYVPELIGAWCWSLCASNGLNGLLLSMFEFDSNAKSSWTAASVLVGTLYPLFLTVLLFHRAERDDVKCTGKYGKYWVEYKRRVPYKIVPGVW